MSNILLILFKYCCVPYISDLFNGICSLFHIWNPNSPSTLLEGIDYDVIKVGKYKLIIKRFFSQIQQ